jgi:predicted phosphodiesterase
MLPTSVTRQTVFLLLGAAALVTAGVNARQDPRAILFRQGPVNAYVSGSSWWLANDSLTVTWEISAGIRVSSVYDRLGGRTGTKSGEAFTIALPDGRVVKGTECTLRGTATMEDVTPAAPALDPGRRLAAMFECADSTLQLTWQAELLPGADMVRQRVAITRGSGTATVADVGFQAGPAKTRPANSPRESTILAGPYLQNPGPSSMTVMWVTDGPAAGWVEYGPGGATTSRVIPVEDGLIDAGGRTHTVRIDGLRPDTAYSYRIVSRPIFSYGPYKVEYGDTARGEVQQFRTLAPAKQAYSFLVMNDLHENVELLRAHMRRASEKRFDLVFFNGDSLSHLESEAQILERNLAPASELFGRTVPFVFVRGNHETRGAFARQLKNYLALPGGRYYGSFDHGPVHFIVLDTGEDKEDGHWAYSGLTDFEAYRTAEAEWLKKDVQTPAFRNATFRVLVAHMPFYSRQGARAPGYGPASCLEHFGAILNEAGLDLHIAGHTHRTDWVEPAPGANRFPISVGGGSQPGTNTLTRVDVSPDRLVVTLTTDDGKAIGTHTVMAKRGK